MLGYLQVHFRNQLLGRWNDKGWSNLSATKNVHISAGSHDVILLEKNDLSFVKNRRILSKQWTDLW